MSDEILSVKNISKTFYKGDISCCALKDISFSINKGEKLGIVGESGSGKSTILKLLVGLEQIDSGEILLKGKKIDHLNRKEQKEVYKEMQMVFQNPLLSFNPRIKLRKSIFENIEQLCPDFENKKNWVQKLIEKVDIDSSLLYRYPHNLSGGQCQRLAIVRALSTKPEILLCDEATSALDILVQKQVVDLLNRFNRELNIAIIFVTHDLSLANMFCDNILVMKNGECVERGSNVEVFNNPKHNYTKKLLDANINPADCV